MFIHKTYYSALFFLLLIVTTVNNSSYAMGILQGFWHALDEPVKMQAEELQKWIDSGKNKEKNNKKEKEKSADDESPSGSPRHK
jgi:hypothetical protein